MKQGRKNFTWFHDAVNYVNSMLNQKDCNIRCPCCNRLVRPYKRTMSGELVKHLRDLYHAGCKEERCWVNVNQEFRCTSRNYANLKYWGLIVQKIEDNNNNNEHRGRTSGLWKVTEDGVAFLKGELQIQAWIRIYNDCIIAASDSYVTINTVSHEPFDWKEQ